MASQGAWDDVPIVGPYDDDAFNHNQGDMFDPNFQFAGGNGNGNNTNKSKKNGNNDMKKKVDVMYEAYVVRPGKTKGGALSWSNEPNIQCLPVDPQAIFDMAEQNRSGSVRTKVNDQFMALGSRRQEIVNNIRHDLVAAEKLNNADWVVYDVKPDVSLEGLFKTTKITKKFTVIFKRIDKNQARLALQGIGVKTKVGDKSGKGTNKDLSAADIVGIEEPIKKKKKNDGVKNKNKEKDSYMDDYDPAFDPNVPFNDSMQQNNSRQHNNHTQHFGQQQHQEFMQPPFAQQHPQMPPPPGAIPVNQFQQGPPVFSARHSANELHPFTPFDNVPGPVQMESPLMQHGEWPPHPHPHEDLNHHRSYSNDGLARRPSVRRSKTERQQDAKINDLQDQMADMALAVRRMSTNPNGLRNDDSGDSIYSDDSTFSRGLSPTRSWTPPSSPRSHFSEMRHRGSLDRRYSGKYRRGYRSGHRGSMEVIPARSGGGSRYDGGDHRMSRRMSLQRSHTYDDYPGGARGMMHAPDPPRPRIDQRRFSEYNGGSGVGHDFRDREFDRERREFGGGRRASMYGDPREEDYDGRRREERRSSQRYW